MNRHFGFPVDLGIHEASSLLCQMSIAKLFARQSESKKRKSEAVDEDCDEVRELKGLGLGGEPKKKVPQPATYKDPAGRFRPDPEQAAAASTLGSPGEQGVAPDAAEPEPVKKRRRTGSLKRSINASEANDHGIKKSGRWHCNYCAKDFSAVSLARFL